jgi:hypothetical protein
MTPTYYRVRAAVRVLVWGTLAVGLVIGCDLLAKTLP